jgi:hypothetical protein
MLQRKTEINFQDRNFPENRALHTRHGRDNSPDYYSCHAVSLHEIDEPATGGDELGVHFHERLEFPPILEQNSYLTYTVN